MDPLDPAVPLWRLVHVDPRARDDTPVFVDLARHWQLTGRHLPACAEPMPQLPSATTHMTGYATAAPRVPLPAPVRMPLPRTGCHHVTGGHQDVAP